MVGYPKPTSGAPVTGSAKPSSFKPKIIHRPGSKNCPGRNEETATDGEDVNSSPRVKPVRKFFRLTSVDQWARGKEIIPTPPWPACHWSAPARIFKRQMHPMCG